MIIDDYKLLQVNIDEYRWLIDKYWWLWMIIDEYRWL